MHSLRQASLLCALTAVVVSAAGPVVKVEKSHVSYAGTSADGVEQFQNIPFGEDTSGANRFAPPKAFTPSAGTTVDATQPGAACPQATPGCVPPMSDVPNQSEDCLNLRIARPADISKYGKPLPVMVYIYGGGSILGEAYDMFFNPVGLVQQAVKNDQPVIYAAMNYRLGVFGFASAGALRSAKSENIGLRDQYLALQWIKENIGAFGGDPNQVTLFGQSFGAISVGLQMVAHGGQGEKLFQKAIMTSSGVSGKARTDHFAADNTAAVAEGVECIASGGTVDEAALDCLRKVPLDELNKVQLKQAVKVKPSFGFASFGPTVDGDIIPDQPDKLLAGGHFLKDIPLLATWTADDGSLSADPKTTEDSQVVDTFSSIIPNLTPEIAAKILDLYPVSDFEDQARGSPSSPQYFRAARIVRDLDPVCPLLSISRTLLKYGEERIHLAELNTTRLLPYWDAWGAPFGVSHLSDIPYFFNEEIVAPGDNSPAALALSAEYSGSFSAFAHTAHPVIKGKTTFADWPLAYNASSDEVAVLIIGGPHGTTPAIINAKNGAPGGEAALALEKERLVERCAYLDSVRVPHTAGQSVVDDSQIVFSSEEL